VRPCSTRSERESTSAFGYVDGALPYSDFNAQGELVGFDIEMTFALAGELGLEIEFVPVPRERLAEVLNAGLCDVIMAGISVTTGGRAKWFSRRPISMRH
jgi:ABC-type amino acid transport substrate-binding protein